MDTAASLPTYVYEPLENDTTIRVLVLLPSEAFSWPLEANLVHLDREAYNYNYDIERYEAVSYCWGKPNFARTLLCNNRTSQLRITENMDEILRHLRKHLRQRVLWVDAISLNQSDPKEKAKQVQLMGEIYQEADKVHVWLGIADEKDHVPSVFGFLKGLAAWSDRANSWNNLLTESAIQRLHVLLASAQEQFIPSYLQRLLSRQWFTRRWILQEIALAQDTTVHCGHSKIAWKWFAAGVNTLAQESVRERYGAFLSDFGDFYVASNVTGLNPGQVDLHSLIWEFHSSECVDPSDRLFSLYGIVESNRLMPSSPLRPSVAGVTPTNPNDPPPALPRIDYGRLWCDLYVDMAQYVHSGYFQEFWSHLLAFQPLSLSHPTYPSWVPNWAGKRDHDRTFSFLKNPGIFVEVGQRTGLQLQCHLFGPITEPITIGGNPESFLLERLQAMNSQHTLLDDTDSATRVRDLIVQFIAEMQSFHQTHELDLFLRSLMLLASPIFQPERFPVPDMVVELLRRSPIFAGPGDPVDYIGIARGCRAGDFIIFLPQIFSHTKDAFLVRPVEDRPLSTEDCTLFRIVGSCLIRTLERKSDLTTVIIV